jgi:precorrin-2 dehydrogenase/sirohydrochlorin ferrochelatase
VAARLVLHRAEAHVVRMEERVDIDREGDQVAAGRILNLLNADANVTLLSPREGLNDEVAYRVDQKQVEYLDKRFEPTDLDDPSITMVLTAIDEPDVSTVIWKICKEKRIAANIADVPPECDFYFGSVHRDGPLQIMVSTNGNGPKMANLVRKRIEASLPPNIGEAIAKVGALRKRLRQVAPGIEEGPKRMKWYVEMRYHVCVYADHVQDDESVRAVESRRSL